MAKNRKSPRKAGRPSHKPTTVSRRKVAAGAGGGMSHDEIAVAMDLSRPTLEKHYFRELHQVSFQKRLDVLDAHYRAAMRGNVAAQKAYLAREPSRAVAPRPPEAPKPAMGKKDKANADAVGAEAGTGWENLLRTGGQVN